MKYILHIIALSLLFVGCGHNTEIDRQLAEVERLIEVAPDSAMAIIDAIDANGLSGREQQAHYALLKSMALDKNYIDTTTFEVLQPAIDYYLKYGTAKEKIRTYYYQGIIYHNNGERDNAMNSFAKAIEVGKGGCDSLVLARAYVAQAYQSYQLYAFEDYVKNNLIAAKILEKLSLKDLESDCLLQAFNGALTLKDKSLADSLYNICTNMDITNLYLVKRRQSSIINYIVNYGNPTEIQDLIRHYDSSKLEGDELLSLAAAYSKLGDHNQANILLNEVVTESQDFDELKYLAIQEKILEGLGSYQQALTTYKTFSAKIDSINYLKFEYMFNSIEARNKTEFQALKEKEKNTRIIWSCVGGIIILVLVVIILLLLFRSNQAKKELAVQKVKVKEAENAQLKSEGERLALEKGQLVLENKNLQLERDNKVLEAENLAHRVEILENESENLKNLMDSQNELPSEVQDTIKVRIEMLNSLLAGYITANEQYEKPYDVWVKELTANTEDFMNSNRLAFKASHPRFIQYFEEHGLSVDEINYVCLYAIGLRGKEVGNYMKKRSHVNISSAIRKKLGIDKHETNIGIYVRKLLREL